MNQDLNPGEQVIDTWTLFYIAPNGGKYNGKLKVTNQRLLYDAKINASALGVLGNRGASGGLIIEKKRHHQHRRGEEVAEQKGNPDARRRQQARVRLWCDEHRQMRGRDRGALAW